MKNLYKIIKISYESNTKKRLKKLKSIGKKETDLDEILASLVKPILSYLEKKINIAKYDRNSLDKKLKRIGSKDSPEIHVAKKFIYPLFLMILGIIPSLLFKSVIIFIIMTFIAVISHFVPDSELNKKIKEQNDKLIKELPRFVRTIRYSPPTKPMFLIVGDYLKVAKGGLKKELKIWHDNVKMGADEKDEFLAFANRISVPEVYDVVQNIIASIDADKDNSNLMFELLEEKIRKLNIDNIKSNLSKRPEKLDIINTIVLALLTGCFAVPILLSIVDTFIKTFN